MKLSTREDVAVPIEAAFREISDFEGFERAALRRGADVSRTDNLSAPGFGMTWKAQFPFRNRDRKADLRLTNYDAPNGLEVFSKVSGIEANVVIELVALSRAHTRMNVIVELKPKSIPARLMIQSMKLAKSNLNKRFNKRVADFAEHIEERSA